MWRRWPIKRHSAGGVYWRLRLPWMLRLLREKMHHLLLLKLVVLLRQVLIVVYAAADMRSSPSPPTLPRTGRHRCGRRGRTARVAAAARNQVRSSAPMRARCC